LRFASLEGAPDMGADSMVWREGDRVFVRSDAVIQAARYLGGVWAALAAAGALLPRPMRDGLYRVIASHRHRLSGPACVVPTPEQRARFFDFEGP